MHRMRSGLLALPLAIVTVATSNAQAQEMTELEARTLVERFLELHNQHRYEEVMILYAEDARFQLNGGRPEVRGKEEIRKLQLFDAYARSHLQPYGMRYEPTETGWTVHIEGVIEHSDVFSALGMKIVHAQPVRNGFDLSGGKIVRIVQPDLNPACSGIAMEGFSGLVAWLETSGDHRAGDLIVDGRLALVPSKIPLIVDALKDWRNSTGWSPQAAAVRECAQPPSPA